MTGGQADRRIRIRLTDVRTQDLEALRSWLGLEEWFAEAEAEHGLSVVWRERDGAGRADGPDGPPMGGAAMDVLLMLASGVLHPVLEDLCRHARVSVEAFAANLNTRRRMIEAEVTIEDGTAEGRAGAPDDRRDRRDGTEDSGKIG